MAHFKKVNLTISKLIGYGQYMITAKYKGKVIKAHTTDSECYDWLEDQSNKTKNLEAKRHAYNKIVSEFNKI